MAVVAGQFFSGQGSPPPHRHCCWNWREGWIWVAKDAKVSWLAVEFVGAPAATVGAGGSSLSVGVLFHQWTAYDLPSAFRNYELFETLGSKRNKQSSTPLLAVGQDGVWRHCGLGRSSCTPQGTSSRICSALWSIGA